MKQFITQYLRSLTHYAFIAIDYDALKDTENEVIEAVQAFKRMYTSRVIIYIVKTKESEDWYSGVVHKVGTMTKAINLCHYLARQGAKICYVETNTSNHLKSLSDYYAHMIKQDDVVISNGICFLKLNAFSEEEYDFILFDMGVTDSKVIGAIKNKCELGIVCATGKSYELKAYENTMLMCRDVDVKVFSHLFQTTSKRRL